MVPALLSRPKVRPMMEFRDACQGKQGLGLKNGYDPMGEEGWGHPSLCSPPKCAKNRDFLNHHVHVTCQLISTTSGEPLSTLKI